MLRELDTVNICVPTPLGENRTPDMQFIIAAVQQVARYLHPEQLIILESTTYPGTTRRGCVVGTQHPVFRCPTSRARFLSRLSPERLKPGNSTYFVTNTPKIIGGVSRLNAPTSQRTFYAQFIRKTHTVSSPRTAEMVKLLETRFGVLTSA